MLWINQIIFWIPLIVIVVVLLWTWRKIVTNQVIEVAKLKNIVILIVGVSFLKILSQIGFLYYALKKDPLGMYLLPGQGTSYFSQSIWLISKPLILGIITGVVLLLFALLIKRLITRPWFDTTDFFVIFLTGFIMGFPGVLLLLLGSLLLMIIWQLVVAAVLKRSLTEGRLPWSPFLLFMTILHLLLSNFNFYQHFLAILHLI